MLSSLIRLLFCTVFAIISLIIKGCSFLKSMWNALGLAYCDLFLILFSIFLKTPDNFPAFYLWFKIIYQMPSNFFVVLVCSHLIQAYSSLYSKFSMLFFEIPKDSLLLTISCISQSQGDCLALMLYIFHLLVSCLLCYNQISNLTPKGFWNNTWSFLYLNLWIKFLYISLLPCLNFMNLTIICQ